MSAFDLQELTEQPQFLEVFALTRSDRSWYYTSHQSNIIINGRQYLSRTIHRSGYSESVDLSAFTCSIAFPPMLPVFDNIATVPLPPLEVTVYRYSVNDLTDAIHVFSGKATSVVVREQEAVVSFDSMIAQLDKAIPTTMYQAQCNNKFCDQFCGLDRDTFSLTVDIVSIEPWTSDNYSGLKSTKYFVADNTVDGFYGWHHHRIRIRLFNGGMARDNHGNYSLILENNHDYIVVHAPLDVVVGDTITLYLACDKTPQGCEEYGNLSNFVGFPYIPVLNPLHYGIREQED